MPATAVDSEATKGAQGDLPPLQVPKPRSSSQWALAETDFGEGVVGGKSGNLARLRGQLPDWVHVPASVALPFGSCERALQDRVNADTASAVVAAQQELVPSLPSPPGLSYTVISWSQECLL